jgi:hypothetical protein
MSGNLALRVGLYDNPKIAEALGELNVAWAGLEFRIFGLFVLISKVPMPIARAVFFSLRTTRARLDLLQAVASVVLRKKHTADPTVDLKRLKKHLGKIGTMAGDRNKFIHDPWGGRTGFTHAYQMRLTGRESQYVRVTRTEIINLAEKINAKSRTIRRLYASLEPKMSALHERFAQQRDLTLELAK